MKKIVLSIVAAATLLIACVAPASAHWRPSLGRPRHRPRRSVRRHCRIAGRRCGAARLLRTAAARLLWPAIPRRAPLPAGLSGLVRTMVSKRPGHPGLPPLASEGPGSASRYIPDALQDFLVEASRKVAGHYERLLAGAEDESERGLYLDCIAREQRVVEGLLRPVGDAPW